MNWIGARPRSRAQVLHFAFVSASGCGLDCCISESCWAANLQAVIESSLGMTSQGDAIVISSDQSETESVDSDWTDLGSPVKRSR